MTVIRKYPVSAKAAFIAGLVCCAYVPGTLAANPAAAVHGEWSGVIAWPHIPVSAANLPDGRILTWASNKHDAFPGREPENTFAATWDPVTNQFTDIPHPSHDMFCAHQVLLEDGRVFVNGGRNSENSPWTSVFDFAADQWIPLERMSRGRWYPTTVALADSSVLTASGRGGGKYPERYRPGEGWGMLSGIDLNPAILDYPEDQFGERDWWPLLALTPDGKVLHAGPTPQMHLIDATDNGAITPVGPAVSHDWYSKHGTTVMYQEGKLLTAGGWQDGTTRQSTNKAMTIDVSGPSPRITPIAPMKYPRKFHNGAMLPTGEVLVIGGNRNGLKFNDVDSVFPVEIWSPRSETWREGAAMTVPRNYHSIALLLTDGRVLSAGGGLCGKCDANHQDGQIYSPPYLFAPDGTRVVRPMIFNSPDSVQSGEVFWVEASPKIQKFSLIKMSSTTHAVNTDLRYIEVPFTTVASGRYQLTAHVNVNVLSPGYWMLFAVDAHGVPSEAKVIRANGSGLPWIANPGRRSDVEGARVRLRLTAGDGDGDSLSYSATGLPEGLTIDGGTGVIRGIPLAEGTYRVTATVDDGRHGRRSASFTWVIYAQGRNQIVREVWTNIGGNSIADLTGSPDFPDNPSSTGILTRFEAPAKQGDDYGTRIRGYLYPPTSGDYTFWIAADNTGELWLSTNLDPANATRIAYAPRRSSPRQWDKYPEQQSGVIRLQSGQRYYIEALQKEVSFGDNLAVAWQVPGATTPAVIPGTALSPYVPVENVALGKSAIQSSTYAGSLDFPASYALDGNLDGDETGGSLARTGKDRQAWWQVDLGALYDIETISVWNRSDCCADRLTDFHVLVSDVPIASDDLDASRAQAGVGDYHFPGTAGRQTHFPIERSGRFVRVQLSGRDFLQLAEVQVHGALSQRARPPAIQTIVSAPKVSGAEAAFSVTVSGGSNLQYKWLFGDGTPETTYSSSPHITHTFSSPGRYLVTATVLDDSGQTQTQTFTQTVHASLTAGQPKASSSIVYDAANDRVWNVNPDNASVSVFDAPTLTKVAEIPVAQGPRSLAIDDTGHVWVVNKHAATIDIIDPVTLSVVDSVVLKSGSQPFGIVFHPDDLQAYVSLEATGELLVLNASLRTEVARLRVGLSPRHLSITADGGRLLVSRFISPMVPGEETDTPRTAIGGGHFGGEVVVVDTADLMVRKTIVLQHSNRLDSEHSGRGIPNYLGPAVISPDGLWAWCPSKQDNILRGRLRDGQHLTHDSTVRAISSRIDLTSEREVYASRVDHDDASVASTAAFGPYGTYLFVALEGNRQIAIVDLFDESERGRITTERAPQGLALSPDGTRLFVHNFMERSISVHDISRVVTVNEMSVTTEAFLDTVAAETLAPEVLRGKQLFYDAADARLAAESYMSCASCHNDGRGDGRVWDFTQFGEGLRNTISLNAHGVGHGSLHWTANFDEVQDFEGQIRDFAGGTGLMSDTDFNTGTRRDPLGDAKAGISVDLDALAAYVASLRTTGTSPYRDADGSLTAQAQSGKAVFEAQRCADCHRGQAYTDSATGFAHDIGTLKPSSSGPVAGLDTPTLRGAWMTPPYLHDGSAATLGEAVRAHNGLSLWDEEVAQLVAYLQQIDDNELSAPTLVSGPRAQAGSVTTDQVDATRWTWVAFDEPFDSVPVVVMGPPSFNGGSQSTLRVRAVTETGFEFQIDEWDYHDGVHISETMSYLAMLPGLHDLDRIHVVAGELRAGSAWRTTAFAPPFADTPVVLTQLGSTNEAAAATTRLRNVSRGGFDVRVDEEEANDRVHATETVYYLAFSTGLGSLNGQPIAVGSTGRAVDDNWFTLNFGGTYNAADFLANMQTAYGGDTAALRYDGLSESAVQIKVEEEGSKDRETNHTAEEVGWVVIGAP